MPEPTPVNVTKTLTYFRLAGESLGQFAAELKKFSPEEKVALAIEVEAYLATKQQA